jgi:hypothetical protein
MATWDSADLLLRCQRLWMETANAAAMTSGDASSSVSWYALLTEAQAQWYDTYAAQVPYVLMGSPQTLTTADSGVTYTFPSSVTPLAVELYDGNYRLLKPTAFYDTGGDYVWEGNKIRFPHAEARPDTYYARYITPPDVIDGSTAPTLVPAHHRRLLVYTACATRAGLPNGRDPAPYYALIQRAWFGNPNIGDVGILGALKNQNFFMGGTALSTGTGGIMDNVSTGAGYVMVRPGGG